MEYLDIKVIGIKNAYLLSRGNQPIFLCFSPFNYDKCIFHFEA